MSRTTLSALVAAVIGLAGCGRDDSPSASTRETGSTRPVVLATTTSTQDSGLLDELVPAFEEQAGYPVKTVAVGSGEAIEMGRRGEADVVLAHSPDAEQKLMESGVAGDRTVVMHNDFVIVGPPSDPAAVKGAPAVEALARIADQEAPFISRGDESGTNAKELSLWEDAGVRPGGHWYQETGSGMGATLTMAAEKDAYTLADRGTYLSNQRARGLQLIVDGGPGLLNVYHVIDIDREAGERVNAAGGDAFARWIVSPPAQRMIGSFGREEYGAALFTPDAGRSDAEIDAAS